MRYGTQAHRRKPHVVRSHACARQQTAKGDAAIGNQPQECPEGSTNRFKCFGSLTKESDLVLK
jgi:hypothetical protein